MSVNKAAIIRYQTLDRCFRNPGRMFFWQDLLDECNKALYDFYGEGVTIKRRQLFDDIKFMESSQGWLVSLERHKYERKVYYRYTDTSFSINNQPLNESEAELIRSAISVMSRFTGTPQFAWIHEMIPVLSDRLGLIEKHAAVIEFDHNPDLKGIHFLEPAFQAIVNKQVIQVKYQDFQSEDPYMVTLHPYYLKQYNGRWFLFGLNPEQNQSNWNLAVDRMESIKPSDEVYIQTDIDWEDYFYDIVGVTREMREEPSEVVLSIDSTLAPYIMNKPIHPTQKSSWKDGRLIVRLCVIPNYELRRLLLSYGDQLTVVSPESLKIALKSTIEAMISMYK